jgi:hypothetical protein
MESNPQTDEQILDEFFGSITETIEEWINRAMQHGSRRDYLALMLERTADGGVVGACGSRSDILMRVQGDDRLPVQQRAALTDSIMSAAPLEIPAVLLAHHEGYLVVGIRRLKGSLVTLN